MDASAAFVVLRERPDRSAPLRTNTFADGRRTLVKGRRT